MVLYGEGAINVHISLFPGADGGYNMTVAFPEGRASRQRGGQPRPQAQPRPRGAQAENWRRRDPAAVPGPKTQPRRRKANVAASAPGQRRRKASVAASAPGQQEGGNAKQRRDAKRKTARRECGAAAPTPAPTAVEELGAGSHTPPPAPTAGAPEEVTSAATLRRWFHPAVTGTPEEVTPAATLRRWFHPAVTPEAAMPETKEAAVPTTPPRAFLATACPPSSGKRGPPRSCSSASPGSWTSSGGRRSWSSSGGRTPPHLDADGFQLVVGRMGKGRSGAKVPKKALERERDESL